MTEIAQNLDPDDWSEFRRLAHAALEAMIEDIATLRELPVWVETPTAARESLRAELPMEGQGLATLADPRDDQTLCRRQPTPRPAVIRCAIFNHRTTLDDATLFSPKRLI